MHNSRGSIVIIFSILIALVVVGVVGYRYVSRQSTPTVINTYEFKTYDEIQADPEFLPFPDKEIEKKFIGINNKGQDVIMYTYDNILDKIEGKKAHDVYKALLETNGWNITESRFNECDQVQERCENWAYLEADKYGREVVMNTHSFQGMITEFKMNNVESVILSPPSYFPAGVIEHKLIQRVTTGINHGRFELFLLLRMPTTETDALLKRVIDLGWNEDCGAFSSSIGSFVEGCSNGSSGIGRLWITDEIYPVQEVYFNFTSSSSPI